MGASHFEYLATKKSERGDRALIFLGAEKDVRFETYVGINIHYSIPPQQKSPNTIFYQQKDKIPKIRRWKNLSAGD
jgi:hypothetical protein